MEENTGVALSQVKGLLANLNDNLAGKHGDYWILALKKMLRKEELPKPPSEVLMELNNTNPHREKMKEKVKSIAEYLHAIPVVAEVYILQEKDDDVDLVNISVYASTRNFIHKNKTSDTSGFYLQTDGKIRVGEQFFIKNRGDIDEIYEKWCKQFKIKNTLILKNFCAALIELGKMYEKAILDIEI